MKLRDFGIASNITDVFLAEKIPDDIHISRPFCGIFLAVKSVKKTKSQDFEK